MMKKLCLLFLLALPIAAQDSPLFRVDEQGPPVSVIADSAEPSDWSTSEYSNVVQLQR